MVHLLLVILALAVIYYIVVSLWHPPSPIREVVIAVVCILAIWQILQFVGLV